MKKSITTWEAFWPFYLGEHSLPVTRWFHFVGTSFAAILLVGLSSLLGHAKLAEVDWKAGLLLGLGGVVGAQVGPRLLQNVPGSVFQKVFACVLAALAVWMFFKK